MPYSYWGADERSHITPVGFVLAEKHLANRAVRGIAGLRHLYREVLP